MGKSQFYSKTLAQFAFFLSATIYGTLAFIEAKQIDFYTCIFLFTKIIPYSLIIGFLGYQIGKIIDNSNNKKHKRIKKW